MYTKTYLRRAKPGTVFPNNIVDTKLLLNTTEFTYSHKHRAHLHQSGVMLNNELINKINEDVME